MSIVLEYHLRNSICGFLRMRDDTLLALRFGLLLVLLSSIGLAIGRNM